MNLSTVLSLIPGWYEAGLSITLNGPIGVGKTSTISAAPDLFSKRWGGDYGLVVINGGNMEVTDAMGYLVPVHKDGHSESRFTRPYWWITTEGKPLEAYKGGLIFVDEEDKAQVDVKKVLGEGKLSGRLCAHTLPGPRQGTEGWRLWSAGNRIEDRSGTTKTLDHLINRSRDINVEHNVEAWTEWANKNNVSPLTIGFANTNVETVFMSKPPEKQGQWCTPRSLVQLDEYLRYKSGGKEGELPTDPTSLEEARAFIGDAAVLQYVNTIKLQQAMPKFSAIIANPDKAKVPEAPDALMLISYDLAHRVTEDNAKAVLTYVDRFPKEFSVTFCRASINRKPQLVSTPAFYDWCKQNSTLMAVLNQKAR